MKYIEITTPTKKVQQMVNETLATEFNKLFTKNKNKVVNEFRRSIKLWIAQSPEMQNLLLGGQNSLAAMFGLTENMAQKAVQDIIDSVANSCNINLTKFDKNLNGEVIFVCQPITMDNLLSLDSGHVYRDKTDLHWLDWLLTKGDTVIIIGYSYNPSTGGISGGGTMKPGGSFRVPPRYSGNISDNFITRAFDNKQKEVERIVGGLLT